MKPTEILAKAMFMAAAFLVLVCLLVGCADVGDTYNGESQESMDKKAKDMEKLHKKQEKDRQALEKREKERAKELQEQKKQADEEKDTQPASKRGGQDNSTIVNVWTRFAGMGNAAGAPGRLGFPGKPAPTVEIPAPELTNVNLYARALEEKLQRRYNNTPDHSGNIAKVQLLPMGKPEVSMDGKKLRMRWAQVVFDIWGKRVSELEEEYYVVTFGDGKPMLQRTRPTITVGLNNEAGFAEFAPVRGGALSGLQLKSGPDMFDVPDSEKTGLLHDHVESKDSAKAPYREYELPAINEYQPKKNDAPPVVPPASQALQAMVVLEEM